MFKLLPTQKFTSDDRGTAVVQAQQWLSDQSENGQYAPLQLHVSGTAGHVTLAGDDHAGWIIFRKDPAK